MLNFFKTLFSPIIGILDFITKYFKTIVFLTIIYFVVYGGNTTNDMESSSSSANLKKIALYGQISDVSKVLEQINKAKEDKNIKGVLFVVNSPGGSVAPSVELAYAIKELKKIKPVVVYTSGVMASGSYYASIWANKIVANPGSMVGSIGVIMQGVNAKELLDKIGVSSQVVKAGKYKQMGTYDREWKDYERSQLQSVIDSTYDMFITDVSNARKLKKEDHTIYADAKIFTASQAKKVGLVDEVGTISTAENILLKFSKVDKAVWKKQDKFDKFMDNLLQETINKVSVILMTQLKAI
jgi:protease-4